MKIVIAEQDIIEQFDEIAARFFDVILGLTYSECLVTDDSRLSEFAFSGWSGEDWSKDEELNALYDKWDAWVIEKIATNYGVRIEKTNLTMWQLFEQIKQFQLH